MVDSKSRVKRRGVPKDRKVEIRNNPDQYYQCYPSWNFSSCDKEKWSLWEDSVRDIFWDEILPRLQSLESQKWRDIFVRSAKQNHSNQTKKLNKVAIERLEELGIEQDSLLSLRITGTHRIYGFMQQAVFHILWVDLEHGDNAKCVYRSKKKHT